jgi:gliding motility-associated-like protein
MKKISRILALISCCCVFFLPTAKATHNRAGEIRIEQIGPLTIRATIITYTRASSTQADRDSLPILWGDGRSQMVLRSNGRGDFLGNDTKRNIYIATHTYPGRSTYRISMNDPNRNGGVLNVNFPNSDNVAFYIQTVYTFLNANFDGVNSTPILLQPPIDKACIGQVFIHNPNAYDPDGDSIAYRLTTPLEDYNRPVPLYDLPDQVRPTPGTGPNILTLNERTGDLVWQSPQRGGEYNVALLIISYRNGVPIDTTIRDMQILVEDNCRNRPPVITTKTEFCVIAGQTLQFTVSATDPDVGQKVSLTALGGPFEVPIGNGNRATFPGSGGFRTPPVSAVFRWVTSCENIAEQPYNVIFKAVDNGTNPLDTIGLSDLKSVRIKVVGPPPEDVRAVAITGGATISWRKPYTCEEAANRYFYAFSVWRRENSNPFPFDTCRPGMQGRGYEQIKYDTLYDVLSGRYHFIDRTAERGKTYCYRILAHFAKRTSNGNPFNLVSSLPSEEACVQLSRDLPLMVNVSVQQTDLAAGRMEVRWTKPVARDLDTILNPPPYRYRLFRATGITRNNLVQVPGAVFTSTTFTGANDTFFLDTQLNTLQNPYSYRVGFYVRGDTLLGYAEVASSVFLSIASSDRINILTWQKDVPWTNSRYDIFRLNRATSAFDSIGSSTTLAYRDSNLLNGTEYCYYVRSVGSYGIASVAAPLYNLSQRICGTPLDTVAPCAPRLTVTNPCANANAQTLPIEAFKNKLTWTDVRRTCNVRDLAKYNIYYAASTTSPYKLIQTVRNLDDLVFEHLPDSNGIAGCYYITAVDSLGNESKRDSLSTVCVDNCPDYRLPNAFTPNGDNANDVFKAYPFRFVERIELKVFNRWGELVYTTTDPNFRWDGKNTGGADLAAATYFYTCRVYERRVVGIIQRSEDLSGYIELIK